MRAVGIAAITFLLTAGLLLKVATGGPEAYALVSAALVAAVTYLAVITRSLADIATIEKFRQEIPKLQAEREKLQLEIDRLRKEKVRDESRVKPATDAEMIKFTIGDLFRGDPPSKW
jgi:uncharacterized membrane protein (DUF106 family)